MEAYSYLCRCSGRTGHVPQIKSGVLCLGGDSYPGGAVVGAVINVDGVAAGVLSAPMDVYVLPDCKNFSAVGPVKRNVGTALQSEVGIALVCDRPIFLHKDLHPALSGREIVNLPPIAVGEPWDVLRDLEPASSAIAAIMDCQVVAVLHVGVVPFDLMDTPHQPNFSAIRLGNSQRWHCGRRCWCGRGRWIWPPAIPPAGIRPIRIARAKSSPDNHFTAGPARRVIRSDSRRV